MIFGSFPYYALQVIHTFYSLSSVLCIYTKRRLASWIFFSRIRNIRKTSQQSPAFMELEESFLCQ